MSATEAQPTRKRRMSAADRREQILDSALDEFAHNGFHETSLEGVGSRAGISKALIYEHFASKRDLHDALLGRTVHEMLERVIAAIATAAPPEERLRAGADAFLSFVEDHREPWRLLVRNPGEPGVESPIGEVQSEIARAIAALMQSDVPPEREDDPEEANFAHFEVEMFGQQLVGAWRGVGIWWDTHREVPRERLLQTLMDFAWLGLDRLSKGETWEPA